VADQYDLIVIGAGPGGYVAAIRAGQLGLKVACVEAYKLCGVCNNVGCIPTKAMLESAHYAKRVHEFADFGITTGEVKLDLAVAGKRARKVAEQGSKGVAYLFKKYKVEHVIGWGRLAGAGAVEVEGKEGRNDERENIIVATGSRPRDLPILKIDSDRVWSSDQAVFPSGQAPATLGIIGAGAIGMEFADVYNAFGTKVILIEALDQILPWRTRTRRLRSRSRTRREEWRFTRAHGWSRRK
jgi:dihydrolipoamide dehydrogenase